jgi:hypothetical protein
MQKRKQLQLQPHKKDRRQPPGKDSRIKAKSRMLGSIGPQQQHEPHHLDRQDKLLSLEQQLTEEKSLPPDGDSKPTTQSVMRSSTAPQQHEIRHPDHQDILHTQMRDPHAHAT